MSKGLAKFSRDVTLDAQGLRGYNSGVEQPSEVPPGDRRLDIGLSTPGPQVEPHLGAMTPPSSRLPICRLGVPGASRHKHDQAGTVQGKKVPSKGSRGACPLTDSACSSRGGTPLCFSSRRHCPCRPLSQGIHPPSPSSPALGLQPQSNCAHGILGGCRILCLPQWSSDRKLVTQHLSGLHTQSHPLLPRAS